MKTMYVLIVVVKVVNFLFQPDDVVDAYYESYPPLFFTFFLWSFLTYCTGYPVSGDKMGGWPNWIQVPCFPPFFLFFPVEISFSRH
jgi:hypothetical protein